MFVSFAGCGGSFLSGAVLDDFPGEWVEESPVVHDAHLFFCSFMQANLELAGEDKWPAFFSVA
jgi:hypothetical protein